jgi:hypothetical protein
MTKVLLTEYNNVIKTVPPDRTDEPFRITVLPWRLCRDWSIPDTHGSDATVLAQKCIRHENWAADERG